jgi:hypothetical protein
MRTIAAATLVLFVISAGAQQRIGTPAVEQEVVGAQRVGTPAVEQELFIGARRVGTAAVEQAVSVDLPTIPTIPTPVVFVLVWSGVGATGVTDAGDGITILTPPIASVNPNLTLPAQPTLRWPLTPASNVGVPQCFRLSAVVRDDGPSGRVFVRIRETNLLTGASEQIAQLDSNAFPGASGFQLRELFRNRALDFGKNVYYVEAELRKQSVNARPALATVFLTVPFTSNAESCAGAI